MLIRLIGCFGVVVGLVALGACTSGGGKAAPPSRLSPPIPANPLDMSKARAQPCSLLRPDQAAQYHLTVPGTVATLTGFPACAWTPKYTGLPAYRATVDLHSGGLEALYHHRATMPVFQPTTVSEYPGIHTATTSGALRHGQCTTEVGVANDTLLVVSVTVPASQTFDYADPCPDADQVAASIIANAEGAAP